MRLALIENGAVVTYPYSLRRLAQERNVSLPASPSAETLAEFGVYLVADTAPPVPDITQDVREIAPVLSGDQWVQAWELVPASAETIAQRQEDAAQSVEKAAAKLDAWIVSYLAMTPAEAKQYVIDNAGTQAQLRGITANLAYAVRVLIRREFNR